MNPSGRGLKEGLENLECTLRNVTEGAETPLSAHLRGMAVVSDVSYMERNLSALCDRWKSRPPIVGEGWTDLDFLVWAGKLREAWKHGRKQMEEQGALPYFHVEKPVPEGMENWRLWYLEESFDRKEGVDKDIDSAEYGEYLQPTSAFNEWFFLEKKMHDYAGFATKGMRQVLRPMSRGGGDWMVKAIDGAVNALVDCLEKLEGLRTGLCKQNQEDDHVAQMMVRFYTVFYHNYVDIQGKAMEEECAKWGANYTSRMKETVVKNKMKGEFAKLLDSGFLNPLFEDYGGKPANVEKADEVFRAAFFNVEGHVRESLVGRYIYIHQFSVEGWREMAETFFRYIFLESLTGTEKPPVEVLKDDPYPPIQSDAIFSDHLDMAKVKAGLAEILTMKASDGEKLFRYKKVWYVVHRMFCEMNCLVKSNEPSKFRAWAHDVYKELGVCEKGDYDAAHSAFKNIDFLNWEGSTKWDICYVETAQKMWEMFIGHGGEREKLYLKPGSMSLYHPKDREKLK